MTTEPTNDQRGICEECGALLPKVKQIARLGIIQFEQRRRYCLRCDFLLGFQALRLHRRPYKVPAPRPTKAGHPPGDWMAKMAEQLDKEGWNEPTTSRS